MSLLVRSPRTLIELIESRGLNRKETAAAAGIHKGTLYRMIRDGKPCSRDVAGRVTVALGKPVTDVDQLFVSAHATIPSARRTTRAAR